MKERPILFSGAMVRAIMREVDPKTQTRRVVKPLPSWQPHSVCNPSMAADDWAVWFHYPETERVGHIGYCPYGKPGDRLWVRESWSYFGGDEYIYQQSRKSVAFKATWDSDKSLWKEHASEPSSFDYWPDRWSPSIHMPRWASRLTLEIVKVRVERLQEISDADAKAEGVDLGFSDMWWQGGTAWTDERNPAFDPKRAITGPRAAFGMLWNSINSKREGGKYAWDKNPWVWVIEFKRLEAHVS